MTRTNDELFKDFNQNAVPADSYAGAAEPNDNTYPATVPGMMPATPKSAPVEYVAPVSNLPMQVTQREILRQNAGRGDNLWTAETPGMGLDGNIGTEIAEGDVPAVAKEAGPILGAAGGVAGGALGLALGGAEGAAAGALGGSMAGEAVGSTFGEVVGEAASAGKGDDGEPAPKPMNQRPMFSETGKRANRQSPNWGGGKTR